MPTNQSIAVIRTPPQSPTPIWPSGRPSQHRGAGAATMWGAAASCTAPPVDLTPILSVRPGSTLEATAAPPPLHQALQTMLGGSTPAVTPSDLPIVLDPRNYANSSQEQLLLLGATAECGGSGAARAAAPASGGATAAPASGAAAAAAVAVCNSVVLPPAPTASGRLVLEPGDYAEYWVEKGGVQPELAGLVGGGLGEAAQPLSKAQRRDVRAQREARLVALREDLALHERAVAELRVLIAEAEAELEAGS